MHPQFDIPVSKKELQKGVKNKLRFTKTHLVDKISSNLLKEGYCFLQGYYFYMSKELMPPFNEEEVKTHLIDIVSDYIVDKLEN